MYVSNVVIGAEAPKKFPSKTLSEDEKRIWTTVSWSSSFSDVLQKSREKGKAKTKLKIEEFQATQSMAPLIPSLIISPIEEF